LNPNKKKYKSDGGSRSNLIANIGNQKQAQEDEVLFPLKKLKKSNSITNDQSGQSMSLRNYFTTSKKA